MRFPRQGQHRPVRCRVGRACESHQMWLVGLASSAHPLRLRLNVTSAAEPRHEQIGGLSGRNVMAIDQRLADKIAVEVGDDQVVDRPHAGRLGSSQGRRALGPVEVHLRLGCRGP